MPTIDFKPVANDVAANVESQAQYVIDLGVGGSLEHGYEAGTALSAQFNKTARQSSMMAAAIANYISTTLGEDVLDDGVLATLIDKFKRAVQGSSFTTGDVKMTIKTVADAGWVLMNDGTIGSGLSGANYANNNAQSLFTLLWLNTLDAQCPVVGGRGGSAAADWAANKKITLPRALGRALAVSGNGAGLTPRLLAQYAGEETHLLAGNESGVGAHHHQVWSGGAATGAAFGVQVAVDLAAGYRDDDGAGHTFIENADSAAAVGHNNVQPSLFLNVMIKL